MNCCKQVAVQTAQQISATAKAYTTVLCLLIAQRGNKGWVFLGSLVLSTTKLHCRHLALPLSSCSMVCTLKLLCKWAVNVVLFQIRRLHQHHELRLPRTVEQRLGSQQSTVRASTGQKYSWSRLAEPGKALSLSSSLSLSLVFGLFVFSCNQLLFDSLLLLCQRVADLFSSFLRSYLVSFCCCCCCFVFLLYSKKENFLHTFHNNVVTIWLRMRTVGHHVMAFQ